MESAWISQLLARSELSDRSRAQYAACLRYWNAWHTLRFGIPLPLAKDPIVPISTETLKVFVEDHFPLVTGGQVTPLMNLGIDTLLRGMGFNRRTSCSAETTVVWRLNVISAVHNLLRLSFNESQKTDLIRQLHLEWVRANTSLAMDRRVPTGRDIVLRLRHACPNNRDGVRCAAMLTLLQYLNTTQLAQLKFGDLTTYYVIPDTQQPRMVEINISEPINRFQATFPKPRIFGADASAVLLWGCVRLYDEFGDGVELAPPDLPFLVRDRSNDTRGVTARWISTALNDVVLNAGMEGVLQNRRRRYWASDIRLRCQRESDNQRRIMEISHRLGIRSSSGVYDILRGLRK